MSKITKEVLKEHYQDLYKDIDLLDAVAEGLLQALEKKLPEMTLEEFKSLENVPGPENEDTIFSFQLGIDFKAFPENYKRVFPK